MVFPTINNYKIYKYNDELVKIIHQDIFKKVYLQTIVNSGGSTFPAANWWHFLMNAKFAYELDHSDYEDEYRKSIVHI